MLFSTDCVDCVAWFQQILLKYSAVQVTLFFQCCSSCVAHFCYIYLPETINLFELADLCIIVCEHGVLESLVRCPQLVSGNMLVLYGACSKL